MIFAVSSAAAPLRSTQNTCAPWRAKVTAVALPLPQPGPIEPAPTTIATLPLSRSIDILPFRFCCAAGLTRLELPQSFAARKQAFGVGVGRNLDQRTADLDARVSLGARGLEGGDDLVCAAHLVIIRRQPAIDDRCVRGIHQA